ncbi:MAG: sodium:solute symporter [Bacteroides sp.]|nr:sodium:solute symporter [Ruminococcus flavefaciens]MCM1553872.1 sodium:solute symporter [Bacteroides sp.]
MSPVLIGIIFVAYTALLFAIAFLTGKKAGDEAYYRGNRRSPWFVVAYGMVGASLSGVTFMSVPGNVLRENFYYLPMVLGFVAGYIVIAKVLLPIYYRLNLTSIYGYLNMRFGLRSYKSGAAFFLLSRSLGATLRMFLVISVLHEFVFKAMGIPFSLAALIFILLILGYTFRGGIKTIVWTDTLQTTFMLAAVVISIVCIARGMDWSLADMMGAVKESPLSRMFDTDPMAPRFWVKQFVSGLFVTVTMTGLDQDMMQKNLSCRNLKDAQKNMYTCSGIILVMNFFFLVLGAILCLYAQKNGILCADTDQLFPTIAIRYLPPLAGLTFVIGVLSAAYSSADGALTAVTTSFTIDILGVERRNLPEEKRKKIRYTVHFCMAMLFLTLIILFDRFKNDSVINMVYDIASYTYGPLLGLFVTGICTKWKLNERFTPLVVILAPVLSYAVNTLSQICWGYHFGFELLLLNGLLTVMGLFAIRKK